MGRATLSVESIDRPAWSAYLELLKPITWFPPMWAFGCGVVSSGQALAERWPFALLGVLLAGPLVCGASQIVNDWFDRDVDAINEPDRPVPSGRVPGRNALYFAIAWSVLSLCVGAILGPVVVQRCVRHVHRQRDWCGDGADREGPEEPDGSVGEACDPRQRRHLPRPHVGVVPGQAGQL